MKPKGQPEILNVYGKMYKLCVFRVETFDENGIPEECTFIPDDRVVELSDDKSKNFFMTAYVPRVMLTRKPTE